MEAIERSYIAFGLLDEVLRKGAYSSIELNKTLNGIKDERDKAFITRLFYGVLSKNEQLEYYLSSLTNKRPKPAVALIIKMGAYMLRYMDAPDYAVISTLVELTKKVGKKELSGFVNAVLRRVNTVQLPPKESNKVKDISVNYSCPEWIVKLLCADYGAKFAKEYLSAKLPDKTHIRPNLNKITLDELAKSLPDAERSEYGIFVTHAQLKSIKKENYIIQSLSSCMAVNYYAEGISENSKVLDLCSAPGGKAVYLRQLTGAEVTACDIHEHRVNLIKSYAKNTGTELAVMQNDATVYRKEFNEAYDTVICDVPCSGLGVIYSKPDIMLTRKPEDISSISRLQLEILNTASKYVKKGGTLCYSTCTVVKAENDGVVNEFLKNNLNFTVEEGKNAENGYLRIFPHIHGADGFFVVKLRRNE